MINKIIQFFASRIITNPRDLEYAYLCEAVDIVDLERRIREIDMRQAPFQR